MKYLIPIFLICLVVPSSAISIQDISNECSVYYADTGLLAEEKTVYFITNWVRSNIDYEYHYYPQSSENTLKTMKGDCTDCSILICDVAEYLNIKDLYFVHGYIENYKHDWIIYHNKNIDVVYGKNRKLIGNGYW